MAALLFASPLVRADEWAAYPQRPIKLLLGYPAGGGGDLLGRLFAARLGQELGQPVVVVNKPGVSGALAAAELARLPATATRSAWPTPACCWFRCCTRAAGPIRCS